MKLKTTLEVELDGEPGETPAKFVFKAKRINDAREFQKQLRDAGEDSVKRTELFYTLLEDLMEIENLTDEKGVEIDPAYFQRNAPQVVVDALLLKYVQKSSGAPADPEKKDSESA